MSQSASIQWWDRSLQEMGIQGMEKLVAPDAGWDRLLESGRQDLDRGILLTNMTVGKDRNVLDIGCGLGRLSQALGLHFGQVLGVDVAPSLIEEARAKNQASHIRFELADGEQVLPGVHGEFDSVFSYEVMYLIPPAVLASYFKDIARVLKPNGEFVFQLNCEPLRWTTQLSFKFRDCLYAMGIRKWRGWPTGKGFRRYEHLQPAIRRALTNAGLRITRVSDDGNGPKQTWFVATKPVINS